MTQQQTKTLCLQCEGLNSIRNFIQWILISDLPQLEKFTGKKVVKADGSMTAKFNETIDKFDGQNHRDEAKGYYITESYYYHQSGQWLGIQVRVCIHGAGDTDYFDRFIGVAILKDDKSTIESVLTKSQVMSQHPDLEEVANASVIGEQILLFEQKQKELSAIYDKIPRTVREKFSINLYR